MVVKVYQHINGAIQPHPMTVEEMFAWNIRFQIITDNEEERDYLYGLQLMYGREVELESWAEWNERRIALKETRRMELRVLPFTFTTSKMNLRGLA